MRFQQLYKIEGSSYRISGAGVFIIAAVFTSILVYVVSPDVNKQALFTLSSVGMFGVVMGLLAGLPRISVKVDGMSLLYGLLGAAVISVSAAFLQLGRLSLEMGKVVFIYAAVCEELAFRFGLQRFLARVLNDWFAWVMQAAAFMLYHWMVYPGYEVMAAFPLIAGLILGGLNALSKDLTAPLTAHVINNAIVVMMS
jgi:membrane protease YdiL (CAAX protease family)